jgi:hypothetical protein
VKAAWSARIHVRLKECPPDTKNGAQQKPRAVVIYPKDERLFQLDEEVF